MGTNPLDADPSVIKYSLLNPPHGSGAIAFPYDIKAGERPKIGVQIAVRHSFRNEEHLAT